MSNKKIVLFPAFRHLVPSDLENWLEQMALKGWHIDKIGQWSSMLMTFRKSEPKKYRFVYDMQAFPRQEYIATYEQFGWEFLGRMASAHMWRMAYEGQRPEAFSDKESLIKRNRRNMWAASVSFFIFLLTFITVGILLVFFPDSLAKADRLDIIIAEACAGIMTILMSTVMIILRKNELR